MQKRMAKEAELFKLRQQLQPIFIQQFKFNKCTNRKPTWWSQKNGTAVIRL